MDVLLLTGSLLGLMFALFFNRLVLGSILSVSCFVAYVSLQPYVTWLSILLFIVGFLMIIFEIMIPGIGMLGIAGTMFLIVGLYFSSESLVGLLIDITLAMVFVIVCLVFFLKKGYSIRFGEHLILNQMLTKEEGYSSAKDYSYLVNQVGITTTPLRPVGKVKFQDIEVEVISSGPLIDIHKSVRVYKIEGSKIIVQEESAL